jgi:hypothetical protein
LASLFSGRHKSSCPAYVRPPLVADGVEQVIQRTDAANAEPSDWERPPGQNLFF